MANKSLTISSGFHRLMNFLALPLLARPEYRQERKEQRMQQAAAGEPVFPIWPDLPNQAMKPHERMRADHARLRQTTIITSIR